jgi:hypothetical protein
METPAKTKGIPASALKIIAIIFMVLGSLTTLLLRVDLFGALAAVLCCFMLTEGLEHTISRRAYLLRLTVFAVMSEIPFDLCNFGTLNVLYQNAAFALIIALLTIMAVDAVMKKWHSVPLSMLITLLGMAVSELIRADYGCIMVMTAVFFYFLKEKREQKAAFIAGGVAVYITGLVINDLCDLFFVMLWDKTLSEDLTLFPHTMTWYPFIIIFVVAGLVILLFYNGKKGYQPAKIGYYLVYPVHMLLMPLAIFLFVTLIEAIKLLT